MNSLTAKSDCQPTILRMFIVIGCSFHAICNQSNSVFINFHIFKEENIRLLYIELIKNTVTKIRLILQMFYGLGFLELF